RASQRSGAAEPHHAAFITQRWRRCVVPEVGPVVSVGPVGSLARLGRGLGSGLRGQTPAGLTPQPGSVLRPAQPSLSGDHQARSYQGRDLSSRAQAMATHRMAMKPLPMPWIMEMMLKIT